MATYLDGILAAHRAAAAADRRDLDELRAQALRRPPVRSFQRAIQAGGSLAVIAEIKRRSPSRGDLAPNLNPDRIARQYEAGGAACLSVLTDAEFFGGSVADLHTAAAATTLPVLRKDFTVSLADVYDTRLMGADAVLLIAAALSDDELTACAAAAAAVGLEALVEVHDHDELARAVASGARLIGVNQRDLLTFEVDHDRAVSLAALIPSEVVAVAESGVRGPEDARRLAAAGYHAVLVGETLVRAADPAAAVAAMRVPLPAVPLPAVPLPARAEVE